MDEATFEGPDPTYPAFATLLVFEGSRRSRLASMSELGSGLIPRFCPRVKVEKQLFRTARPDPNSNQEGRMENGVKNLKGSEAIPKCPSFVFHHGFVDVNPFALTFNGDESTID